MAKNYRKKQADYYHFLKFIKKFLPKKISARRRPLKNMMAYCTKKDRNSFLIVIDRELHPEAAIMVLIHELAHVLSWDSCSDDDHCLEWAIAYYQLYKKYEEWLNLEN